MTIDTETTIVTFYREIDRETGLKSVLAYFPLEYWNTSDTRTCYASIGQHSACSPDYVKDLPLATKKEYTELKNELESIGYNLKIV